MSTYMHCRPFCGTNIPISSSLLHFVRSGYITTSNYQTTAPSLYHHYDQTPPPPVVVRHRRRLEDPITNYASNYYVTFPCQMTQLSPRQSTSPSLQPLSLSQPNQTIYDRSRHDDIYCDLFNLLECPSPPTPPLTKQRRKYKSNDYSPCRQHCRMDIENLHTKVKCTNDRKRQHQKYNYYKEKKRQDDKLSSIEQYERSPEKTKKVNNIYPGRASNRGFFRRVVRNYFCLPSTLANNGYSS
ncbi:unnamed protein product [Rotaria socialis]|uniref:Uncharacterized protein n=2 Tax=Rotaria socialis TaxID=392032 RepID=A0A818N7D3_9BILA|nr:unnamed protein product [Rotaria socialis]